MAINTASIVGLVLLGIGLSLPGQATAAPTVNFCDVVRSPALNDERQITTVATLSPSDHSLLMHSDACEPKSGFDVRAQAVLPAKLKSLPNGGRLESILGHGWSARVEVVGTFQSTRGPYGPDVMPFRFVITGLNSVVKAYREK